MQWVCLSKKSLSPFEAPREKEPVPQGKRSLSLNESPLEPWTMLRTAHAKTARSGRCREAVLVRLGVVPRTILTQ
jgi:hypothetical protein